MNHRLTIRLLSVLAVVAMAALGGCLDDKQKKELTLQRGVEKMFGVDNETPEQQAAGAFDEKDPDVRRLAIEKLSNKKWALREPYLKRFSQLSQEKFEADPSVRAVAIRTLGKAGDTKYMPQIIGGLSDSAAVVRWDAATVLTKMPDKEAIPSLQKIAITDESVDARAAAATALAQYRQDSVYRTLLRVLEDGDFSVRSAAHGALVTQTGVDHGYDPQNWVKDPTKAGKESLPARKKVVYRKRPWWDWCKITEESETVTDK